MDGNTAFWGMTINNYDETDLALVRQGYPDFIRQLVYTLEAGTEKETPHIQAYIRLFRQHRMSYVKKLFPRGSFKAVDSDEYKLNAQRYAQKLDSTARSPAIITNNPFPDPVVELTSVLDAVRKNFLGDEDDISKLRDKEIMTLCCAEERQRVREKPTLAKFYVSATYRAVKKEFWRPILFHLADQEEADKNETHTHTHTQPRIIFSTGSITNDGEDGSEDDAEDCEESGTDGQVEGEDYSDGDCSEDEADSEGGDSEYCEEDDCEESSE